MSFEDKIVKFENKFDKYVFNITILNKIIAILTAMFVIFVFVFYIKKNNYLDNENKIYEKMLADLEAHQLAVIYSNVTPNDGTVDTTKVPESPIFTNAKDAVLCAFNNFYNYTQFENIGNGSTTAVAVGQTVEVGISFRNCKFLNGTEFNQNVRKELYSNFGQTDATQTIYKNGNVYERHGSNIRKENGYWVADFNSSFHKKNKKITHNAIYLVNEKTIQFSKSFSFARDNKGKVAYYKATVMLNPVESTRDYALDIMEQGGTSLPVFSYVELACIIDRDGHFMSYNVTEKMTLSKHVVVDVTTTMTNNFTTIFLSHNVAPSIPEPHV